jgi:ATP synthase protein I
MDEEKQVLDPEELKKRIDAVKGHDTKSDGLKMRIDKVQSKSVGVAFRLGIELLAGMVVGVGIGILLDKWLSTLPLFLIVFFFLGAAAGMFNIYRALKGLGYAMGYEKPKDEETESKE